MTTHSIELNGDHTSVFWISDMHEGNALHNSEKFKKAVDMIYKTSQTKDVKVILGGDMLDCINFTDKRFNPKEVGEGYDVCDLADLPRVQMNKFLAKVEKIKHIIVLAHIGNHEAKIAKNYHYNVFKDLCEHLECEEMGLLALTRVHVNFTGNTKRCIDLASTHGATGAGATTGGALNNIEAVFRNYHADVYLIGHTHHDSVMSNQYITLNKRGMVLVKRKYYGNSGAFLNPIGENVSGYFEARKGCLADVSFLELKIDRINGSEMNLELLSHVL